MVEGKFIYRFGIFLFSSFMFLFCLKWLCLNDTISTLLTMILYCVSKILLIFLIVAFFTVAERRVLGAIHRRRGPSIVGVFGLLQPIADALKLFLKELLYPVRANRFIFLSAPWWILNLSVLSWFFIPFHFNVIYNYSDISSIIHSLDYYSNDIIWWLLNSTHTLQSIDTVVLILILLAVSSLNVYGIILAGWSSNSKYAFLGGLRSAAQMVSYEVSLGLTILPVVVLSSSLNAGEISLTQQISSFFLCSLFPSFIMFLISMLAETNRTPFDLPEAEAELVAGYNVEYSAITFAMFFLGEYSNMLLMSVFGILLFFGGISSTLHAVFPVKILLLCFFFILVRASVPRLRYDQLMRLCWKAFLPVSIGFFVVTVTTSFIIYNSL